MPHDDGRSPAASPQRVTPARRRFRIPPRADRLRGRVAPFYPPGAARPRPLSKAPPPCGRGLFLFHPFRRDQPAPAPMEHPREPRRARAVPRPARPRSSPAKGRANPAGAPTASKPNPERRHACPPLSIRLSPSSSRPRCTRPSSARAVSCARSKTGVHGAPTVFPRVGKGTAAAKACNGVMPVMNLDYSAVECFLQDYYAGE